ncbi:MAG: hypothetical protein ACP5N3_01625 [Candidatus Nanoarchaeia archaeon]
MELLPPKPPKAAGEEKLVEEKYLNKEYISPSKTEENSRKKTAKSTQTNAEKAEGSNSISSNSAELPLEKPIATSVEEQVEHPSIDEKIAETETAAPAPSEKKRGFFSRLFGKKEKPASTDVSSAKHSEEEEMESLRQSLGMTDPSRKIALQDVEKSPDYVARTSWDSQIVDLSTYRKPQDYSKEELPAFENKTPAKKAAAETKSKEKPKKKSVEKPKAPVKVEHSVEDLIPQMVPVKPVPVIEKKKVQESNLDDIKTNWESDASAEIQKASQDNVSLKQADAKLKKIMNVYNIKIAKMVKDRKKALSADLSKISTRAKELQKKEAALSAKEQKLSEQEKIIADKKKNLDDLFSKADGVAKNRAAMEKDIEKYKKILGDQRAEMLNAKKSYDYEKKELTAKRNDMQQELKRLRETTDSERKKGEDMLERLRKQVEDAQKQLDLTIKKSQDMSTKLRNRELALEEKERKVQDLIDQEKKMLALLKGNTKTPEDVFVKKAAYNKPVRVVEEQGESEIYVDDEDSLNQKIQDCKDLLKDENYEDAKMLYNEIRADFSTAEIDEARKPEIKHQIRELYDEIALAMIAPKN